MRSPVDDEYGDPIRELRYEPEISTRDVADLLGVRRATVRRWVARGYIRPVGKLGASNLFDTSEVLAAYDDIRVRRRASGQVRREYRYGMEPRPIDRIRPKHHDAVVSVDDAARLIGVCPATIRSWMHRGHLIPLATSRPRTIRLRLGDVVSAAQARQLQERSARSRHGRPQ